RTRGLEIDILKNRAGPLAVHGTGLHVRSNSEAVNPEARSRAGRPCVGGSKSRNRLSEGLAWPGFFIRGVRPASQDFNLRRALACQRPISIAVNLSGLQRQPLPLARWDFSGGSTP